MEKYFKDLDVFAWSGKTIIVDIDGTITTDSVLDFDPLVFSKIQEMAMANSVFLFSNNKFKERNDALSGRLQIPFLKTPYKKPNKKVISALPENLRKNIVVVGDKSFIDGLFAKNINAEFIKVKRLTGKTDRLVAKLIYFFDDIIGPIFVKK